MRREDSGVAAVLGLILISVGFVSLPVRSRAARTASQSQAQTSQPTVGTTFKNIQVLTDLRNLPPGQLYSAMQFMAGSLSVSCNYCHVSEHGPFDSDAKKTKRKAREMIKMTRAINMSSFGGQQIVTCNTCHHGSPHPTNVPSPWYKTAEEIAEYNKSVSSSPTVAGSSPKSESNSEGATDLPTVDQVMERYRRAVGDDKLKSLRLTGTYTVAVSGDAVPVRFEADFALPDEIRLSQGAPGSESGEVVNKDRGWRLTSQGVTELPPGQIAAIRYRSQELLPVKYRIATAPRKVAGAQTIDGKTYWVVEWRSPAGIGKLFFDQDTGLLYKFRAEVASFLGTRVEERTFEDYRTVNGVKLAFLITEHYMEEQGVYKVSDAETNVSFAPATFLPGAGGEK